MATDPVADGGEKILASIRSGAQWYKVFGMAGTDEAYQWVAVYTIPGTSLKISFTATEAQMESLFGTAGPDEFSKINQRGFERLNTFYSGGVERMEGTESFESAYERAIMAGLNMTGIPESMRDDPTILGLVFVSVSSGWSKDKLYEEIAKTDMFKKRFPNINKLLETHISLEEAVTGYLEYEDSVKTLSRTFFGGAEPSQAEIGALIGRGHSLTFVQDTFTKFAHLEENLAAMKAFNEILVGRGMEPLDEDGMYDFIAGNSMPALYKIYEESSLMEAARAAGLDTAAFTALDAKHIRQRATSNLTYDNTFTQLQSAARQLLQYRTEINLGDLDQEDIIDLSLGIKPRSGRNLVEISEAMTRALRSAEGFIQKKKLNPYFGYTTSGAPTAAGLARSRVESV